MSACRLHTAIENAKEYARYSCGSGLYNMQGFIQDFLLGGEQCISAPLPPPTPPLNLIDFNVILDIFSQTDESLFNLNLTLGICIC